jgi:hypothetical protein
VQEESPIMSALAAAEDRGAEFVAALRKRASKKPMPSAMKGNKGNKPPHRKRITFVDSDAEDDQENGEEADGADGGSSDDCDGDFTDDANGTAAGAGKSTSSKKGAKAAGKKSQGKGGKVANVANVKKLVELGGGWKQRVRVDEAQEDAIEDDINDDMVRQLCFVLSLSST